MKIETRDNPLSEESILSKIYLIRGMKVMLDFDLAELYGVTTKRLNEQVRRNSKRFPEDFMFRLTEQEKQDVVAICDHLTKLRYSPYLPFAFTEHVASILNSEKAILVNIQIIRVFNKMRYFLETNSEILRKIETLFKRDLEQDQKIEIIFEYIRHLEEVKTEEG